MSFVKIKLIDFTTFLKKHYPSSILSPETFSHHQYIFDIPSSKPNVAVRIFSSIQKTTGLSTDYGEDTIKVILVNTKNNKIVAGGDKHIKRMANWRLKLTELIPLLLGDADAIQARTCPLCNAPLILVSSKHGASKGRRFYGCTNYPKCKHTESASTSTAVPSTTSITPKLSTLSSPLPFLSEQSDIDANGFVCPKCKGTSYRILKTHRDRDNDITHWDAECATCGLSGEILND
jgi:ssDNA-binding Zn-finger/Zn-ribbon topoisomerase 1